MTEGSLPQRTYSFGSRIVRLFGLALLLPSESEESGRRGAPLGLGDENLRQL